MSRVEGHEVARWAQNAVNVYGIELEQLREQEHRLERELEQLAARELEAWEQLTVTLVPGLVAEHLDWASNLLRLPAIAAAQVHGRIVKERAAITAEIDRIEADPEFVERELRLNEIAIQVAELDRSIEPLRASTTELKQEEQFELLLAVGYDTPRYTGKWYELSYYSHWKWGDYLVETYAEPRGLTSFAELRARFEEEAEALQTLESERARWVAKRSQIEALAARHAQQRAALASIEDRHWAQTRNRVRDHLSDLFPDDLLKLLAEYEPGLYAGKRIAGIVAKRSYLRALRDEWVVRPRQEVSRKRDKALRSVAKFQRSKNYYSRFDAAPLRRKFEINSDNWDKRRRRVDVACNRIVAFDRYDAYDVADDVIWWHLMTNGEVKARFIPDVERFYDHRAQRSHDDSDAHELAVAALADEALTSAHDDSALDDFS